MADSHIEIEQAKADKPVEMNPKGGGEGGKGQQQFSGDDPYEVRMRELEEEIAAGEKGDEEEEENAPAAPDAPKEKTGAKPAAKPEKAEPEPEPVTIPKARFDEAEGRRRRAEQEAEALRAQLLQMQGRLAERGAQTATGKPAEPEVQKPSTADQIDEIEDQIDEINTKVANADMTAEEATTQKKALRQQMRQLRKQLDEEQAEQGKGATAVERDLQTHAEGLYRDYPLFRPMLESRADTIYLREKAYELAEEKGLPIGEGPQETMRLRWIMAQLSNRLGPAMGYQPAQSEQTPAAEKQPSAEQKREADQRREKAEIAASMPPDTAGAGVKPELEGGITESQWAQMTPQEREDAVAAKKPFAFAVG